MRLVIPKRPAVKVGDAFSTTLYTGTGAAQDITTGVDLVNHDGLVWIKNRAAADAHILTDTARGAGKVLSSNATTAGTTDTDTTTAFGGGDFSIGADVKVNTNTEAYASWTFRKARRFFDVAEVTKASGSDATVSFPTLGTLGMVVVKRTDNTGSWYTWHRSLTAGKLLYLDTTAAEATLGHITVSGTTVTLEDGVIADGDYIIYAWAHDVNSRGIVQCGSYTGNGSTTGPEIDLGWRPQWLLVKKASVAEASNWYVFDTARNLGTGAADFLNPDISNAENTLLGSAWHAYTLTTTGFDVVTDYTAFNENTAKFIYLAIREE